MADILVGAKNAANNLGGTGYSVIDLLGVMIAKRTTEIALIPIIGNGTWKSAFWKGIGATALYMAAGTQQGMVRRIGMMASAGMAFDSIEDASIALIGANPLQQIGGTVGELMGNKSSAGSDAQNGIINVEV